jgi:hypothetical protein
LFSPPLLTLKIVAAIQWEALRLWLMGARLGQHPNSAVAKTANTDLATGKCGDYTTRASTTSEGALRSGDASQSDRSHRHVT